MINGLHHKKLSPKRTLVTILIYIFVYILSSNIKLMHITLETDYAIRIITYLIRERQCVDAKKISDETEVTLRFALKILRKLVAAGFVNSFKGVKGGYEYAKESPKDLSLYDVIVVIEGECFLSRCLDVRIGCNRRNASNRSDCCKVQREFAKVSAHLKNDLKEITFERLI